MFSKVIKTFLVLMAVSLVFAGISFATPGNGKGNLAETKYSARGSIDKVAELKGEKVKSAVANAIRSKSESTATCSKGIAKSKLAKKFGIVCGKTLLVSSSVSTPTTGSIETSPCVEMTVTPVTTSTVEASGTPLGNVHLRLMVKKGKRLVCTKYACQSNRKGVFAFKHVREGEYYLKVWSKNATYTGCPVKVFVKAGMVSKVPPLEFKAKVKKSASCSKRK